MTPSRENLIQQFVRDRRHYLGFLRVLTRDAELAEELFQELSVVVLSKIDSFDHSRDLGAWVRGIARNLYRDALKGGRRKAVEFDSTLIDAIVQAYETQEAEDRERKAEQFRALSACIEKLPNHSRKLLDARYRAEQSAAAVAAAFGMNAGSVDTALCRIRAALLECVKRQAGAI